MRSARGPVDAAGAGTFRAAPGTGGVGRGGKMAP